MGVRDEVERFRRLLGGYKRSEISRREFIELSGLLSATAVAVAACGSGTSKSTATKGQVTIPLYSEENDPGSMAFYAAVAADFEKQHPHVKININYYQGDPTFLEAAFESKHDVGIFEPMIANIPAWAGAGYLLPVDDVIKSIGTDDFIEGTRVHLGGHDWAVPFQKSSSGLWYRKDALEAVGISKPPSTFSDLIDTLKEVHGRNGLIGMALAADSSNGELALFSLTPFVLQTGWGYFNKQGHTTFGEQEVFNGLSNFFTIAKNYSASSLYSGSFSDLSTTFVNGHAVFLLETGRPGNTITVSNPKLAESIGYTGPPPSGPFMTGKLNFGFAKDYCIDAKTQSPQDALNFVKYMTSGKNSLLYALTVPGQPLPCLKSVSKEFTNPNTPEIADNKFMQMSNYREWVQTGISLVPYATNEEIEMGEVQNHQFQQLSNVNPWASEVWGTNGIDTVMIQEVVLNGQDETTAWKNAVSQLNKARLTWLSQNPSWKPSV